MTYKRVIPRDLFNEANLLKCYGQLALALEPYQIELKHDGGPFEVLQDSSDGSLTLWPSVSLIVGDSNVRLYRPLNSRDPWPLYAEGEDGTEWPVFDDDGRLESGFRREVLKRTVLRSQLIDPECCAAPDLNSAGHCHNCGTQAE